MQELKTKFDLNSVPTAQLVAELVSRNGASVYNCDLYKQCNYRATIIAMMSMGFALLKSVHQVQDNPKQQKDQL